MPSVADALRQHADGYLRLYGERMPTEHKRVLAAIIRCRTGALGSLRYDCRSCRRTHWVGRSCGNRHCPNMSVGQDPSLAGQANRSAVAGALLSGHVYGARGAAEDRAAPISEPAIKRCSIPVARRFVNWLVVHDSSARIDWDSSEHYTRGGATHRSIIRTFTSSFPAAE